MIRPSLLALLLLVVSMPAQAGIRAVYSESWGSALVVAVNDRGDAVARIGDQQRIILKGGEAFIVEERLTGPIVTRAADLETFSKPSHYRPDSPQLRPLGARTIAGRTGQAYGWPKSSTNDSEIAFFVIDDDPTYRPLGIAMRRLLEVETLIARREGMIPDDGFEPDLRPIYSLLDRGVPIQYRGSPLQSILSATIADTELALPGPPESREMLGARLKREAEESKRPPAGDTMILRAVYEDRKLWLLTDDGKLSSIAEGDDSRRPAVLDAGVVDICVGKGGLMALAEAKSGDRWTLLSLSQGEWRPGRTIARLGERPVALDCDVDSALLLTGSRVIDLVSGASLGLAGKLNAASVRATMHTTSDWIYVGLNAGEWGGGLQRIDRKTGTIASVEKNATGELCDGPLNGSCDPVNGIATIPWRPQCVAAAIGLIHLMAHGRIVSVCTEGVEQLLAVSADPNTTSKGSASGDHGAVAFFGIIAQGGTLLAAGHNGLYRITAQGETERQPWPLFKRIGGVLVSFERPDVVLVMSELNRRASISGISPLLVPR